MTGDYFKFKFVSMTYCEVIERVIINNFIFTTNTTIGVLWDAMVIYACGKYN